MMTVGERILKFRKAAGLTQSGLAELVGVTDKAVSKWERNVSCPDISLLSNIARALNVTADELLNGEKDGEKISSGFISLEKYLMGDCNYFVPDLHPECEEISIILDCPFSDDASHGYALSGKVGAEVNHYIYGRHEPFTLEETKRGKIGVTYVSNVPLTNLDPPINKLVDELEYTRLNKYHLNRLLLEGFIEKFKRLVFSDTVKIILLTREFTQKYFGAFISHARADVLSLLQEKISSKKLKIIYTGPPHFWNAPTPSMIEGLAEFKEYLENTAL